MHYLLETNTVLACLVIFYHVFLRKLTFHSLNRVMLLLFIPLTLFAPLIDIPVNIPIADMAVDYYLESEALLSSGDPLVVNQNIAHQTGLAVDIPDLLAILYWTGFSVMILMMLRDMIRITMMKHSSKQEIFEGVKVLRLNTPTVFSFWRWVFVPLNSKREDLQQVIRHEKAHIKLSHTLDLFLVELMCAMCWFNPFVYLYRRHLKSVHEFQADEKVLAENTSKSDYLTVLLKSLVNGYESRLTSGFKNSNIKNRVDMITKHKSARVQILKYLFLAPIISMFIAGFTTLPETESFLVSNVKDRYSGIASAGEMEEHSFSHDMKNRSGFGVTANTGTKPSIFPIAKGLHSGVYSPFGMRKDPISDEVRMHYGIDVKAKTGTPVLATGTGEVTISEKRDAWGNLIAIDHGDGLVSWYAHLASIDVKKGDGVKVGDVIGTVGSTGRSTAPHLHYSVRKNGRFLNPEDFYQSN